jgi:hypothetical protein
MDDQVGRDVAPYRRFKKKRRKQEVEHGNPFLPHDDSKLGSDSFLPLNMSLDA